VLRFDIVSHHRSSAQRSSIQLSRKRSSIEFYWIPEHRQATDAPKRIRTYSTSRTNHLSI